MWQEVEALLIGGTHGRPEIGTRVKISAGGKVYIFVHTGWTSLRRDPNQYPTGKVGGGVIGLEMVEATLLVPGWMKIGTELKLAVPTWSTTDPDGILVVGAVEKLVEWIE